MFLLGARTDLMLSHQWYNVLWHYNNIARVKYCSDHGSEGMTDWLPRLYYTADSASSCITQSLAQS